MSKELTKPTNERATPATRGLTPLSAPEAIDTKGSPTKKRGRNLLLTFLEPIASLRMTVVLFVLSLILIFYGTWAQIDDSIWTTVNNYFRSRLVWIPLKTVLMRT